MIRFAIRNPGKFKLTDIPSPHCFLCRQKYNRNLHLLQSLFDASGVLFRLRSYEFYDKLSFTVFSTVDPKLFWKAEIESSCIL